MTVLEELYEHLESRSDSEFWNAEMILEWAKENKQRYLNKEQEQLSNAWQEGAQEGAAEAQSNAARPALDILQELKFM